MAVRSLGIRLGDDMNAVAPVGPSTQLVLSATAQNEDLWARCLCWWALALLHVTACTFSWLLTVVYTQLGDKAFGSNTFLYDLILAIRYLPPIGAVFGTLGMLHLILLVRMLYVSVKRQRLSFNLPPRSTESRRLSTIRLAMNTLARNRFGAHAHRLFKIMKRDIVLPIEKIVGRRGWIGVDGPYFDHFFVVRELVQVFLQTIQLFKMARLLSTAWLLHVYVAIVCINCWSSKVLRAFSRQRETSHSARDSSHERRRRMYTMLIDVSLDNLTTFFMPLVIMAPYVAQYDRTLRSFPMDVWGHDLWIMQVAIDIQLLFVVSWADFAMKLVFALLVLVSTSAIHDLCHDCFDADQATPSAKPDIVAVSPLGRVSRIHKVLHAVLIFWGIALAGIHTYATSQPLLTGCLVPVRPWFYVHASCAVFQFDCHLRGSNGNRFDTSGALMELSPAMTMYVTFCHCRALEIPHSIQSFRNLLGIKIYNATLSDWPADAAVRADYHVSLRLITMVRISFPHEGHGLPDGLLHPKFPPTVADMNVCVSNLKHLPSDLDSVWPRGLSLLLEMSRFDSFPDVLIRMDLSAISLNGNRLSSVPVAKMLLPDRRLRILSVGGNPIVDLDHNETKINLPPAFYWLIIDLNEHLTTPPLWLTDPSVITRLWLIAGGTPVCEDIVASRRTGSAPPRSQGFLWQNLVDCTPYPPPMRSLFRLFTEDAHSSLDRERIGDPELGF
jgi:hypothetical protein